MALDDKLGLSGTPAFVIGDEVVSGAVGADPLRQAVSGVRQCGKATCEWPSEPQDNIVHRRALLFSFEAMHEPSAPPRDLPQKDNDETVRIVRAFAET
jgi:hypothetical protein